MDYLKIQRSFKLNKRTEIYRPPETLPASDVSRNLVRGGGLSNSIEDRGQRERGSGGGSPLVRGSGGSCDLIQEISLHIVKFS